MKKETNVDLGAGEFQKIFGVAGGLAAIKNKLCMQRLLLCFRKCLQPEIAHIIWYFSLEPIVSPILDPSLLRCKWNADDTDYYDYIRFYIYYV